MSTAEHNGKGSDGKKRARGSVNNKNRLAAFAKKSHTRGADWGECSPDLLQQVVCLITEMGGAVIFGMSRDQGAHSVQLMLGTNRETLWFNGDAILDDGLRDIVGKLKAEL